MSKLPQQFLALWRQLGLNQRVSLVLATVAVLGVLTGLVVWSHRPRMQLLYGRLSQKDASEVVAAIQAQGISYEIGAGGQSVYVPADKVYTIRMDLASKGLPNADGIGFEIFDKSNFGVSDFVQHTNYLRAIQGELTRTISQLNGVRAARVMVVMPENKLILGDNKTRPTASVFVDAGAAGLSTESVNSIRFLVANSVEGMKVDDVAVVDSMGNVLSEKLRDGDPMLGSASSQIKLRKNMEDYFASKVESMLAHVVGPGNAVVRVSADMTTEASTTTQEKYDPEGQVLRSTTTTDESNLANEGKQANSTVGATANTPNKTTAADGTDNGKKSEETRKSQTQTYEISRATTNTTRNPGEVRKLTAAVFLATRTTGTGSNLKPDPRTPEEMKSLRAMVANALGIAASQQEPSVTIQEMPFQGSQIEKISPMGSSMLDTVRPWVTPVLALLIIGFFLRQLKRTSSSSSRVEVLDSEQSALMERNSPARLLENGGRRAGPAKTAVSPEMLNEMIRQKPDNVSVALREWMTTKQ